MDKRKLVVRILVGLPVVLLLAWFAHAHGDQSVDLHFGLFTLRDISLAVALFLATIVGMLIVLIAGLRSDLRAGPAGSESEGKRARGSDKAAGTGSGAKSTARAAGAKETSPKG